MVDRAVIANGRILAAWGNFSKVETFPWSLPRFCYLTPPHRSKNAPKDITRVSVHREDNGRFS